ncbi:hypothetical protein ASG12_10305 [Williamsia sp. Leaf354]|nr:hypothetical protein ASG12_10305 [Williamsia sp. Leaf354]
MSSCDRDDEGWTLGRICPLSPMPTVVTTIAATNGRGDVGVTDLNDRDTTGDSRVRRAGGCGDDRVSSITHAKIGMRARTRHTDEGSDVSCHSRCEG